MNDRVMKRFWLMILFLMGVTAVSCTPETPPTQAPIEPVTTARVTTTTGIEPTRTGETTGTAVPTHTPIPTSTPTATDTPTVVPTLSADEALTAVSSLYETNGGCLLPCWWGFTPGSSLWTDVKAALLPMANEIYEVEDDSADPVTYGHVFLPSLDSNTGRSAGQSYLIKSGIIQAIRVFIPEPSSLFIPVSILKTYGMPEEIYLRSAQGDTGFFITLFYPQHGFRIGYAIEEGTNENGLISACFQGDEYTRLTMWSPGKEFLYTEASSIFSADDPSYDLTLLAATGMDIPTFYEIFRNPDVPICLETPTDLWPGY